MAIHGCLGLAQLRIVPCPVTVLRRLMLRWLRLVPIAILYRLMLLRLGRLALLAPILREAMVVLRRQLSLAPFLSGQMVTRRCLVPRVAAILGRLVTRMMAKLCRMILVLPDSAMMPGFVAMPGRSFVRRAMLATRSGSMPLARRRVLRDRDMAPRRNRAVMTGRRRRTEIREGRRRGRDCGRWRRLVRRSLLRNRGRTKKSEGKACPEHANSSHEIPPR